MNVFVFIFAISAAIFTPTAPLQINIFLLIIIWSQISANAAFIVMVFYFTTSEGYMIYMGADKFENEDLIRYGIPEDLW